MKYHTEIAKSMRVCPYRLWAVNIFGQANDEVMGNGIHQVAETGITVQNIVQRGRLHSQILEKLHNTETVIRMGTVIYI